MEVGGGHPGLHTVNSPDFAASPCFEPCQPFKHKPGTRVLLEWEKQH